MAEQKKPILYSCDLSPYVRSVYLVAAAIGLELEIRQVDLFAREQYTESFLKLNPQHTVPVLDDNGKIVCDSHAIATYLVGKYGKDDSLYPTDLYKRARVDQRLHFDSSVLYRNAYACNMHIYLGGGEVPQEKLDAVDQAYKILEQFLETDTYLAADSVTVADLIALNSVTTLGYHIPITAENYPNIYNWLQRLTALPYYEECSGRHLPVYFAFLDEKIAEAKK